MEKEENDEIQPVSLLSFTVGNKANFNSPAISMMPHLTLAACITTTIQWAGRAMFSLKMAPIWSGTIPCTIESGFMLQLKATKLYNAF